MRYFRIIFMVFKEIGMLVVIFFHFCNSTHSLSLSLSLSLFAIQASYKFSKVWGVGMQNKDWSGVGYFLARDWEHNFLLLISCMCISNSISNMLSASSRHLLLVIQ
jgi:hypothetical protein